MAFWSGSGPPRFQAGFGGSAALPALAPVVLPVASAKISPNGSLSLVSITFFSSRSRSSLYRPGFSISPLLSPNISLLTPTPFVIHAGCVFRPLLAAPESPSVFRSSNFKFQVCWLKGKSPSEAGAAAAAGAAEGGELRGGARASLRDRDRLPRDLERLPRERLPLDLLDLDLRPLRDRERLLDRERDFLRFDLDLDFFLDFDRDFFLDLDRDFFLEEDRFFFDLDLDRFSLSFSSSFFSSAFVSAPAPSGSFQSTGATQDTTFVSLFQ